MSKPKIVRWPPESHPLPDAAFSGKAVLAPRIKGYGVASWCPTPDGSGKPVAVAFHVDLEDGASVMIRMKSAGEVQRVVAALIRHMNDVWPETVT